MLGDFDLDGIKSQSALCTRGCGEGSESGHPGNGVETYQRSQTQKSLMFS